MGNVKANNSNSLNTYLEGAVCTSTANQTAVCRPGNLKKRDKHYNMIVELHGLEGHVSFAPYPARVISILSL